MKRSYAQSAIGLAVAFALLGWWAHGHGLTVAEIWLLHAINGLPDALKPSMLLITQLGSVAMVALTVVLLAWAGYRRHAVYLLAVSFLATLAVVVTKGVIARPRPYELLSDVHVRVQETYFGFPSGHTTTAMVLACYVGLLLRGRWVYAAGLWVAAVGCSRLYLGVHGPADIVGGLLLGASITLIAWAVMPESVHKSVRTKS